MFPVERVFLWQQCLLQHQRVRKGLPTEMDDSHHVVEEQRYNWPLSFMSYFSMQAYVDDMGRWHVPQLFQPWFRLLTLLYHGYMPSNLEINDYVHATTLQNYFLTLPYKCVVPAISFSFNRRIWVRPRNCGCLVSWFCYQLIAKPGNKTAAVPWPDPYQFNYKNFKNHIQYSFFVFILFGVGAIMQLAWLSQYQWSNTTYHG